jgi:hypothetical protein
MICRLKAIDWNSPKRERREFVFYEETWDAKNWLGVDINPYSGHFEGKYSEVVTRPVFDNRTGDHIDNAYAGVRDTYYIPFSKDNVDEIIAKSAYTDKHNIRFVVKWDQQDSIIHTDSMPMAMSTRNQFPYDMFLWDWEKLSQWQYWNTDDILERPKAFAHLQKQKSATKLEFKPTQ